MPANRVVHPRTGRRTGGGPTALRAALLALGAGAVVFLYWAGTTHNYYDLRIYMNAMRWWADGHPLYDYVQSDPLQGSLYFTYPPFTALLLRPFAVLPIGTTIAVFAALTVLAIAVTTWWLVVPIADRRGASRWFVVGLAVPVALVMESTRETITFGQINMLLVALVLTDLLFAVPRRSRWSGVGIGLATALKLFPGIFVVFLLAARRWRAAATAAVAAAAATLLAVAVAPRDSWRYWTVELWLTDRVGRTDYTGNQSLFGLLSRLSAPEAPPRLLWLALVAVTAGYGLWRAARAARAGDWVAGLTLTGLVGALASPITWTHHVYWFFPAMVVLVDAGLGAGRAGVSRAEAGGAGVSRAEAGVSRAEAGGAGVGAFAADRAPADRAPADRLAVDSPADRAPADRLAVDSPADRAPADRLAVDSPAASDEPAGPPHRPGKPRYVWLALAALVCATTTFGVVSFIDWGVAVDRPDSAGEFLLRNLTVLMAALLVVVLPVRRGADALPDGPAEPVGPVGPSRPSGPAGPTGPFGRRTRLPSTG